MWAAAALGLLVVVVAALARGRWRAWGCEAAFVARAWRGRRAVLGARGSLAQRFGRLARRRAARVFLRFEERSFTYGQAERESNRLANALLRAGGGGPLAPGRTAALLVANEPAFVWAWIGLAKLGVRTAFLGTALRAGALLHCLRACGATALLVAHGESGAAAGAGRRGGGRASGRGARANLQVRPGDPRETTHAWEQACS